MQRISKAVFKAVLPLVIVLFISANLSAQTGHKCAFDRTLHAVIEGNPSFQTDFAEIKRGEHNRALAKSTVSLEDAVIPVVFHVILTEGQLAAVGGEAGVAARIDAQMAVLNRDFSAANADTALVPGGFKSLIGNTGVRFALAHTAPDGSATPGYEITTTIRNGFNLEGGWGSGFGFSGAKYVSGGGVDAWDVESYMNIWIINPLENATATNILGLAIPKYLATPANRISPVEQGVILHYGSFGDKNVIDGTYLSGSDLGRTLTHEVGHYLELLHIWGDDEGKCPWNGGDDDGIDDTPPQSYPSSGCYAYPKFDGCTQGPDGDGIMFMNYMDYSNDACLLMFTKQQSERMRNSLKPGANVYALTQQPWLTKYPDAPNPVKNNKITLYPNPSDGVLNISFYKQSQGLQSIHIVDMTGRVVMSQEQELQSSFYTFQTTGLQAGLYLVVFTFEGDTEVHKLLVR